jgi:hypothetical protein
LRSRRQVGDLHHNISDWQVGDLPHDLHHDLPHNT